MVEAAAANKRCFKSATGGLLAGGRRWICEPSVLAGRSVRRRPPCGGFCAWSSPARRCELRRRREDMELRSGAGAAGVCLGLPWPAVVAWGGSCGGGVLASGSSGGSFSSWLLWPAVEARRGVTWRRCAGVEGLSARLWCWEGWRGDGGSSGTASPPRRKAVLELVVGAAWPCMFSVKISLLAASGSCGLLQRWRSSLFQAACGSVSSSPAFADDDELRWLMATCW